jgi:hypothetical protein
MHFTLTQNIYPIIIATATVINVINNNSNSNTSKGVSGTSLKFAHLTRYVTFL